MSGTQPNQPQASTSSPMDMEVLRGGVKKLVLQASPDKNPVKVPPLSKVNIGFTLYVIRWSSPSSSPEGSPVKNTENSDVESEGRRQVAEYQPVQSFQALDVMLGRGTLLPGVEVAIMSMCVGEQARFEIPPERAYGEAQIPEVEMQQNETLVYDIQVKQCYPEVDISPAKNRAITKHIVLMPQPKDNSKTPPIRATYESTVTVAVSAMDEYTLKPLPQQTLKFDVGGASSTYEFDLVVQSMVKGELANVTINFDKSYIFALKDVQPAMNPLDFRGKPEGIAEATKRRQQGNEFYAAQQYIKARDKYVYAMCFVTDFSKQGHHVDPKLSTEVRALISACYYNAAQAQANMGDLEGSINFSTLAIEAGGKNPLIKHVFRRAKSYRLLRRVAEAEGDLNKVIEMATADGTLQDQAIQEEIHEFNALKEQLANL